MSEKFHLLIESFGKTTDYMINDGMLHEFLEIGLLLSILSPFELTQNLFFIYSFFGALSVSFSAQFHFNTMISGSMLRLR